MAIGTTLALITGALAASQGKSLRQVFEERTARGGAGLQGLAGFGGAISGAFGSGAIGGVAGRPGPSSARSRVPRTGALQGGRRGAPSTLLGGAASSRGLATVLGRTGSS